MEKVTRQVKQALSMLLVAAMVITMVPQATFSVSAQEVVESVSGTVETASKTLTENVEETEEAAEGEENIEETEETAEGEENIEETEETVEEEDTIDETEETNDIEESMDKETEPYSIGSTENSIAIEHTLTFAPDAYVSVKDVTVNGIPVTTDENKQVTFPEGREVTFRLQADEGYKVGAVTYQEGEDGTAVKLRPVTSEGKDTYVLDELTADATVTVTTELDETACNTLEFDVVAKHVRREWVRAGSNEAKYFEPVEGTENTYIIDAGVNVLQFLVCSEESYVPVLSVSGDKELELEHEWSTKYDICRIYQIPANGLQDGDVITIGEKKAERKVTISYPADAVELTASVAGREILPDAQDDTFAVYTVTHGDVINFAVTANDYYQITGAQTTVGTTRKNERTAVSGFSYSITASADAATEIQAQQITEMVITPSGGEEEYTEAQIKLKVAPAYTTKLGIKKLVTKLYTGQADIEVAQVTFDKNTTFRKIEVTNADELHTKGLAVTVAGDKIQVTVGKSGLYSEIVGRYTIQVAAVDGSDVMKTATTSFTVDVLQGIEDLTVVAPAQVYKVGGKTVSFNTAVKYNNNVPAVSTFNVAKKVTWSLTDAEGDPLSDVMAKLITINQSGKVTVARNYIVSADKDKNTFKIVATAADYKGNTVTGSAEFVITAQAAQLGEVVILSGNPYNGGKDGDSYDVVARSNGQVSAYKGTYAFVLKKDAVQKDQYSYAEFLENVADVQVTFTSGNKKALEIDNYDGELIVHSGAKNVKITATATDGSKVTSVLSGLNVAYIDTEELGLEIVQISDNRGNAWKIGNESQYKENQAEPIGFYGKKDTCFEISVKQLVNGNWKDLAGITDYKLKADGAKILERHVETGMYKLYAVKDTITLTLTDKPKDKERKTVKTYVLHNASVSTQKAPKVTTKDVLYGGTYYNVPQSITYTFSSLPKQYELSGKYALITMDVADSSLQGKKAGYDAMLQNTDGWADSCVPVDKNGRITLTFGSDTTATDIPIGSYKLNISLGTVNGDGRFMADTRPAAVTLKAVAQKTVKTKLNRSYTMYAKDGIAAELKLSNSKTCLTDAALMNVNIKGAGNKFTKYFEIVGSAEDGFRLKLKENLSEDDVVYITGKAAKNDLTGWVYYKYRLNDDVETAPTKSGEAQIRITFKETLQKYSLTRTTIYSDEVTASVRALAGKKEAVVSYAVATEGYFGVSSTSGSTILLYKKADAPEKMPKKNKITLYIVPIGGCYDRVLENLYNTYVNASEEEKATAKAGLETAIRKYGVKVSATISVRPEKNPALGTGEKIYVSASADAMQADGSAEHPFTTIGEAVDQSGKGAEIIIGDGTYEPFSITEDFSGEKENMSIIRAAEQAHPVIQVPPGSPADDSIGICMENVSHVRVEGLEIIGGTHGIYYESNAEVKSNALSNITIRDCKIHNVNGVHGIGIYGTNAAVPITGLKIEKCEVYDCRCGDSESVVVNGNIDGFEICNNVIHDNNNIGVDMIGFEGTALRSASYSGNRYDTDYVRNGKCYGNTVSGISAEGNDAYLENGVYSLCAAGIYVDGGQNIKIYNNKINNCDIGIEVATEHNPAENSLFQVSGIEVYNNEISECTGFAGLAFGGYDMERGFTVDCRFHHNTLRNNPVQIVVQRSKNNEIDHNTIIGGTTVVEYNAELPQEEMDNDFHDNSITQ